MTDPRVAERYRALAEVYGGTIARWPAAERAAAARWATTPDGARALAQAEKLDRHLDLWSIAIAPEAVASRIAARAPAPSVLMRARWWWSGLGIAAALAGAVAGTAGAAFVGAPRDLVVEGGTAFGELGLAEEGS
ncbi:hypothetical protein KZ813_05955 [Sphingomonas sp. RHCKR7]|uniref:hypothetical protein n=1 Tax=Sphingomonas folli TaxID=2862497 RepID=UPI001CA5C1EF|nr:hypothetical protein [Sphingomonas folli]MBW6526378.1 hypothetical protein [Sphingomonas folli]